jgi:hypothetical protein
MANSSDERDPLAAHSRAFYDSIALAEPLPLPALADRDREEYDALIREPAFLLFRCRRR